MCFSMTWLMNLLIWIVIIAAVIAILKLIVPLVVSKLSGEAATIVSGLLNIALWAFVIIVCIYIAFGLISCLLSMSGGFPSLAPHR